MIPTLASLVLTGIMAWAGEQPGWGGDFDAQVAPILVRRCLDCHSGPEPKGKLDLSSRATALAGGQDGLAIVPGKPNESPLWERVSSGEMPPKSPLPATEKAVLRGWIAAGARWGTDPLDPFQVTTARRAGRDWWSLQPVKRPRPPVVGRVDWVRGPIDGFVLDRLEANGLSPAGEAEKRSLARRLSFDLLGLPPAPEEVDAFLSDTSPGAYQRLVDHYLASPQYGVRWARWWLDLARYGESNGFEFDEFRPGAWRYRDWVVDALNRDMPYDEFARLQLAGDVLRPNDAAAVKATGFLVAGPYDTAGQGQQSQTMKAVVRGDELEDVIGTVGQTFLGLTVNCARCHDHKFDPVRQVEYYGLASALSGVRHGERDLSKIDPKAPRSKAYVVTPREAGAMRVHIRGNPNQLGQVVKPGGVSALVAPGANFGLAPDAPEARRRLELADWVCNSRNPLFTRVIVNRLWQAHFGVGLVETPSDLGWNGGRPSHPELLDWLASELIAQKWSIKAMHRIIVSSAAYRQSSSSDAQAMRKDAGDRLLWRKAPMRLEAEMVRDAMLAVSGMLDTKLGGPSFRDEQITQAPGTPSILYSAVDPRTPGLNGRTLFRLWARGGRSSLLDAFDCPDPSTSAPRRAVTTTPLQALALMNNALVLYLSDALAARLAREAGPDARRQVERAYRLAFGRGPEPDEQGRAVQAVENFGLSTLARAIFNSNEFLYLD
ncbi:MAG: PSD1 and planctomycete cytochrome C domain-containing protein [Isosphaerales bacterium]